VWEDYYTILIPSVDLLVLSATFILLYVHTYNIAM
jgi:hypothetical protein